MLSRTREAFGLGLIMSPKWHNTFPIVHLIPHIKCFLLRLVRTPIINAPFELWRYLCPLLSGFSFLGFRLLPHMHVLVNTQRKSQRGGPSADLQSFLLLPLSLLLYSALWTPDILIFPNSQVHLSPIQGHCWTQPGFHNYVLWSENSPAIMLGDHRIHFIWFPSFRDNCLTLSAVHHLKAIVLYFFLFV